jgi:phosphate:Na+ symporter
VIQAIPVSVAQQIALAHVLLNLIIVVLFIFFLRPFATMMNKLLPGKDEALPLWPEYLDSRDTGDPELAMDHVQKELQRQMIVAQKMFGLATNQIKHYPPGGKRDVSYIEMAINNLSSQIVKYLREISGGNLSPQLSQKLFSFTAMARDIQSMGNHIAAISRLAAGKADKKIKFTQTGEREFDKIILLVGRNLSDALSVSQIYNESKITGIVRREEEIDAKVKESYSKHLERFHKRECNADAGPIFVEMLIHLERISDLCNNIAEYVSNIKEDKKDQN